MTAVLEVFLLQFVDGQVLYKKHILPRPDESIDPDEVVDRYVADLFGKISCIQHSSSWRWEAGVDIRTYFVYCEEFNFIPQDACRIPLDSLDFSLGEAEDPPKMEICPESKVLAHAIRHLAFQLQFRSTLRDDLGVYGRKLRRETISTLTRIPCVLAGRI